MSLDFSLEACRLKHKCEIRVSNSTADEDSSLPGYDAASKPLPPFQRSAVPPSAGLSKPRTDLLGLPDPENVDVTSQNTEIFIRRTLLYFRLFWMGTTFNLSH
jgi:hypothetical protein